MSRMKLLAATLAASLLAAALGGWILAGGERATEASPALSIGVDANPSGNTATSLGTIERDEPDCRRVENGDTFHVDIFTEDVTGLLAWQAYFGYDPLVINVIGYDVQMLLAGNAGSQVTDASAGDANRTGRYAIGAADIECTRDTPGPCEDGDGVLARLTLQAVGAGRSWVWLPLMDFDGDGDFDGGPIMKDVNNQPLGDTDNDGFADDRLAAWIAVGQDCTSEPPPTATPWPTGSPTPTAPAISTPTPAPTAAATGTPTGVPTPTPGSTATPTPPSPSVAWRHSCYLGASQPTEDALGQVSGDVLAAYRLGRNQAYDTWFRGEPGLSTMTTLEPYDALFLLMSADATWDQQASGTPPTSADLVFGWNSVCYAGTSKEIEAATAAIAGQFGVVYALAPDQTWQRFIPDWSGPSTLNRLEPSTCVLILVTGEGELTWVFDP